MKAIILVLAAILAFAHASLIAAPILAAPHAIPAPITRIGAAAGPIVATGGILGHPVLARTAIIAPLGSGLEGQWIRDNLEHLYDDGSYKIH